jgi:hypothetical protein
MEWLVERAKQAGCKRISLDSGTQRGRAHKFYFSSGLSISSYHFTGDIDR